MQSTAAVAAKNRGVVCKHCGKAIRLPASILRREEKRREAGPGGDELETKVFPARCRACHAEGIYAVDQIVDL